MHRGQDEAGWLRSAAIAVLAGTSRGPLVGPPDGRWYAAMTAIGLSRIDLPRAVAELRGLLSAQQASGMLPHSVLGPTDPGAERRASVICALPIHAIAVRSILDRGRDNGGADLAVAEDFVVESFDRCLAWHRWLVAARDPDGVGLVEIHHPWESGFDDSARWDQPLRAIVPSVEATRTERHLWLIEQLQASVLSPEALRDFRVRDVLFSAILAASSEVLADIGDDVGRSDVTVELKEMAARLRSGVAASVDPDSGLARDFDVRAGAWIDAPTVAGFAPLVAGGDPELLAAQRALLLGQDWMGHEVLRYPLPPTESPSNPGFRRRAPWRGPVWPAFTLLLGWAATRDSAWDLRAVLHEASLDQLRDHAFTQFYEPITGDPLGPTGQATTAAAALEWLA